MSEDKHTPGPEGWVYIAGATKWHYVRADGRALCARWLYLGRGPYEQGKNDSPDNCTTCRRALSKASERGKE